MAQLVEDGFKRVRGQLTEGRYLTFETLGLALASYAGTVVGFAPATRNHSDPRQRWIVHAVGTGTGTEFYIQSAADKKYIAGAPVGLLTSDVGSAQAFRITYNPKGAKYRLSLANKPASSFVAPNGKSRRRAANGAVDMSAAVDWEARFGEFSIYSVSYRS